MSKYSGFVSPPHIPYAYDSACRPYFFGWKPESPILSIFKILRRNIRRNYILFSIKQFLCVGNFYSVFEIRPSTGSRGVSLYDSIHDSLSEQGVLKWIQRGPLVMLQVHNFSSAAKLWPVKGYTFSNRDAHLPS